MLHHIAFGVRGLRPAVLFFAHSDHIAAVINLPRA